VRAARWRICMAWGTDVPRVIAGKLARRGGTTFARTASWLEAETARVNEQVVGGEAETPRARRRLVV
jgi:hypothetical protein